MSPPALAAAVYKKLEETTVGVVAVRCVLAPTASRPHLQKRVVDAVRTANCRSLLHAVC